MVELKCAENNAYTVLCDGKAAGVIEYKEFWQKMPYLTLLKIAPEYRGKGVGREAMRLFENEIRAQSNTALLTSTRADEQAQHFYRKIGYNECGCLILENTPFSQPMEMFFIKVLN